MKQILIKKGQVTVEEVPAPQVEPGTVLVAVNRSCISAGTEMSGIRAGSKPLWKRALEQPDNVRKVINMAISEGIGKTKSRVESTLSAARPIGYSLSGIVVEVGERIHDIKLGARVACAGAQYANHAEIVRVPRNLVVNIPDGLDFEQACTVTLGAIAMQGIRRLNPTLGECFVVIGLGILGQITAQLLKANGCRVIGVDLDQGRIELACSLGMDMGLDSHSDNQVDQVFRVTDGIGADGVVVTAATPSSEVLSTAFKMCRKKGRVVLVGNVGLDINRSDIYSKELDFFISTSYGPGRYDQRYEEQGLDYPVSYVRWTENRNMSEYLRLVAQGKVNVKDLISAVYPIQEASTAYADLQKQGAKTLISLLSYPQPQEGISYRLDLVPAPVKKHSGKIRIAVVGAGGFVKSAHLPNLKNLSEYYDIRAICSRTGHNAQATAEKFRADYATTDYDQIISDPDVDAVIIATRHHLHASMTLQALNAGKHVLVEKPLCLTVEELDTIREFYSVHSSQISDTKEQGSSSSDQKKTSTNSDNGQQITDNRPLLLTGFNRRFSPHIRRIKEIVDKRTNPMIINYRMNAGYIPLDNWVHGSEGGGRNIGEACHIYDLFTFLTDARFTQVNYQKIRPGTDYYTPVDNFICAVSFDDGSVATLTYTALGTKKFPKEKMEIYVEGQVLVLEDYKSVEVYGSGEKGTKTKMTDKGLVEELRLFAKAIKSEIDWPNPLWQQIQTMEIALIVDGKFQYYER